MGLDMKEYGTLVRLKNVENAEASFKKLKEMGFSYCQLVYKPEKYTDEDAKVIDFTWNKRAIIDERNRIQHASPSQQLSHYRHWLFAWCFGQQGELFFPCW